MLQRNIDIFEDLVVIALFYLAYVKWLYDLCIICFADIRISNDFGYNKKGREYGS